MVSVPFNFGGLKRKFSDYGTARYAVLPVPYEKTTTYLRGTAGGPKAIIEASRYMELYDEELGCNPAESGIATLKPLTIRDKPERMVVKVKSAVTRILKDGKFPVALGGEHTIAVGCVSAMREHYGKVSVLQFDAHADLKGSYKGSRFNHGCALARIREYADTVSVGIRSLSDDEAELAGVLRAEGRLFYASDVLGGDRIRDIMGGLSGNVYVTFDVDCLDPSIMPSTGTPEPGGLNWYTVLSILRAVTKERTAVGLDIVELSPSKHNKAPDYTAARLAYKMMGYVASKR